MSSSQQNIAASARTEVPPNFGRIPLCEPYLGGNEWEYIKECLDTNWVSSVGSFVDRFEGMLAEYVGASHAVATSSGTAALHLALLAAGVEPGDEVLVPTLTFVATANAVRYAGAWPVFIDAEDDHWQMDPDCLVEFLSRECQRSGGSLINQSSGRRVKAVLPVHLLGHPCDMDRVLEASRSYDLAVIEDATESLGATYKEQMSGRLGDIACFSFNGNKLITTGSGGMVVTENQDWARKARYLATQAKDDPVEYIHHEVGYNYRLTNLQAAMGCAQLERITDHITAKRRIAKAYSAGFKNIPGLQTMKLASWAESVSWLFTIRVNQQEYGMDSRELMAQLGRLGIQSRPVFQPLHLSAAHAECQAYQQGVAETIFRDALSLPSSVGLNDNDQDRVIEVLRSLSRGS